MKKLSLFLVTSLFLGVCSPFSYGQTNIDASFDHLKSDDFGIRKQAIEFLGEQRGKIIKHSIAILNGNYTPELKDSAATLLGDYRASEAVDVLGGNIALDTRARTFKGILSEDELHPVITALEKIGAPSIPVLLKNIQENDVAQSRSLSLRALLHIEGDKDIVQLRLQKALDAQADEMKKTRLRTALKSLPEIRMPLGIVK